MSNTHFTILSTFKDLIKRYTLDYFTLLTLIFTSILVTPLQPAQQYVNIYDSRIQYPYHDGKLDKVPDLLCIFYGMLLPLIVIIFIELLRCGFNVLSIFGSKRAIFRIHGLFFGFFMATFIDCTILVFLKMWISQPRPDFISRCQVNSNLIRTGVQVYKISEICLNPDKFVIMEGLRSTPSGHSAISFTGLNFLSLYLFSNLHKPSNPLNMFKILVGYSPLYLATYIATSRLADYKHSLFDISFGSTIGIVISILVWKHYDKRSVIDPEEQEHGFVRIGSEEFRPILPI